MRKTAKKLKLDSEFGSYFQNDLLWWGLQMRKIFRKSAEIEMAGE